MAQGEGQALNLAAAEWLARLQREDCSEEERAALERWLHADPAHAVAFARAEFAWERAERLRAVPSPQPAATSRLSWQMRALAASVAIAVVGGLLAIFVGPSNQYATGVGERRVVTLADGSSINLNTNSQVEVEYAEDQRLIRLKQGEALFKVARDPQRPFIVQAGESQVKAVGTAFNVRLRDQVVEVTVTEGVVAIADERVEAGAAAVIAASTVNRVSLPQEVVRRRVAWRDGVIELKGETLEQAAEEFNRYRKQKLVIADPAIASIRVGGRFETDEAGKFLNAMQATFSVRVVEGDDGTTYLFGPE